MSNANILVNNVLTYIVTLSFHKNLEMRDVEVLSSLLKCIIYLKKDILEDKSVFKIQRNVYLMV